MVFPQIKASGTRFLHLPHARVLVFSAVFSTSMPYAPERNGVRSIYGTKIDE